MSLFDGFLINRKGEEKENPEPSIFLTLAVDELGKKMVVIDNKFTQENLQELSDNFYIGSFNTDFSMEEISELADFDIKNTKIEIAVSYKSYGYYYDGDCDIDFYVVSVKLLEENYRDKFKQELFELEKKVKKTQEEIKLLEAHYLIETDYAEQLNELVEIFEELYDDVLENIPEYKTVILYHTSRSQYSFM